MLLLRRKPTSDLQQQRLESNELLVGVAILITVAIVYGAWIWWGLEFPTNTAWAIDAITPADLHRHRNLGFPEGWSSRYPPLHIYILSIANALSLYITGLPADSAEAGRIFFLLGGVISLCMAIGTVGVVFAIARELRADTKTALLAATLAAFSAPVVLYAKTTNLDVPYVFWFSLALYYWLKWVRTRWTPDAMAFAAFSVFAVTTKDQAAALLILPAALSIGWTIRDGWRNLWPPIAVTVILAVLILNPITNLAGIRDHISILVGEASQPYRMFDTGIRGTLELAGLSVRQMLSSLGWPALLIGILGLGHGITSRGTDGRWRLLGLPILSYMIFFIGQIGYTRDRFWIPVHIILALYGALLLSRLIERPGWTRTIGVVTASIAVAVGMAKAASVDLLMACDGRHVVQEWMVTEIPVSASVLGIGYVQYLPNLSHYRQANVEVSRPDLLVDLEYDFVITTSSYGPERWIAGDPHRRPFESLESGESGYAKVLDIMGSPRWTAMERKPLSFGSNIGKIAPRIRIYRREGHPGQLAEASTHRLQSREPFCAVESFVR